MITIGGGDGIGRRAYGEFDGSCDDGDACIDSDGADRHNGDYGHN